MQLSPYFYWVRSWSSDVYRRAMALPGLSLLIGWDTAAGVIGSPLLSTTAIEERAKSGTEPRSVSPIDKQRQLESKHIWVSREQAACSLERGRVQKHLREGPEIRKLEAALCKTRGNKYVEFIIYYFLINYTFGTILILMMA